jgi:hypothetical protein
VKICAFDNLFFPARRQHLSDADIEYGDLMGATATDSSPEFLLLICDAQRNGEFAND